MCEEGRCLIDQFCAALCSFLFTRLQSGLAVKDRTCNMWGSIVTSRSCDEQYPMKECSVHVGTDTWVVLCPGPQMRNKNEREECQVNVDEIVRL